MRRTLFVLAVLMIPAALLAAPTVYDQVWGDRVEERLCAVEAEVGIESPECVPPTTSSTTTTTQLTTTTTVDTTTTTSPPGLVIPPTQPYPARGTVPYKDGGGYDIIASNATTGTVWWTAPYWCSNGLDMYPGQGCWISGDREGYRCGYGFIVDANGEDPNSADNIVGRFAFVRGGVYGKVLDKYMEEAERYLDGTPTPYFGTNFKEIPEEDCTDVRTEIDYSAACRDVDERPRVGFFDSAGNVLDIRDYSNTVANGVIFNLHSFDGTTATVLACEDGLVGMIVYYTAMGDGQLAVEVNGTTIGE